MNNGMRESDKGEAYLPEVQPLTFLNFFHHAQSLTPAVEAPTLRKRERLYSGNGALIARMLDRGFAEFRCQCCDKMAPLACSFWFPRCEACKGRHIYHCSSRIKCISCGGDENVWHRVHDLVLCNHCRSQCGIETRHENQNEFPRADIGDVEKIILFRFDVPLLASDISASSSQAVVYAKSLIDMKQVVDEWKFAELYAIPSFGRIAICTLFENLAMTEYICEDFIALSQYVYDVTPDSGIEMDFDGRNILRRLVVSYAAYKIADLLSSATFRELLCGGGEITLDIMAAICKVKEGRIGRGYGEEMS